MQKAWQAWTFVDSAQKSLFKTVAPRGGVRGDGLRLRGLAQFGREVFCPWRPLEVRKPWHARTFAAAELAASMTLES